MSVPRVDRVRPSEAIAGLMASAAIFAALVAVAYRPMRIAPFALLIALIAAGMGGRHSRLAAFAVFVTAASWFVGMTIAVITDNPLY